MSKGCGCMAVLLVLLALILGVGAVHAQTPAPDPDQKAVDAALALVDSAGRAGMYYDPSATDVPLSPPDAVLARFSNAVQNAMTVVEGLNLDGCKAPWRDTLMAGLEHLQFSVAAIRHHADQYAKLFLQVGSFLVFNSAPLMHDLSGCS